MRDMVPRTDRSIRNIPVPTGHRRPVPADDEPVSNRQDADYEEERHPRTRRRKNGARRMFVVLALVVVVICAVGGVLLSTLFAGASVTVFPHEEQVTPPQVMVAQVNAPVGTLPYVVMSLSRSGTTTVAASGTKQVSRQASGVMTMYNAAGTASQRLIANTRFAAPDGKIYRIHDSVVVPGGTKNADGTITPGSASATVYADSAGVEYNRGETKFTIPGFKGDPRYDKFYATASSVTNGFVGQEPAIAPAELAKAQTTMQQALDQAVRSAISSQVPEGFLPLPGTLQVTYGPITQAAADGSNATISQTATAVGAVVRASSLAAAIAKQGGVQNYNGEAVGFKDVSQLSVAATTTKAVGTIQLQLSGKVILVWQYDAKALKDALVGKPKTQFQSIIQSFQPAITRAEAKIRPFWQGSFPSNPDKITLTQGTN